MPSFSRLSNIAPSLTRFQFASFSWFLWQLLKLLGRGHPVVWGYGVIGKTVNISRQAPTAVARYVQWLRPGGFADEEHALCPGHVGSSSEEFEST